MQSGAASDLNHRVSPVGSLEREPLWRNSDWHLGAARELVVQL